jgi:hypothetical protein
LTIFTVGQIAPIHRNIGDFRHDGLAQRIKCRVAFAFWQRGDPLYLFSQKLLFLRI